MLIYCRRLLGHDVRAFLRQPWSILLLVAFLVMAAVLGSFAVGPNTDMLARMAPALVWVGLFLAALLGAEQLFRQDLEDGSLDMLVLAPMPLELLFLIRCVAHWLATGVPLALFAPVVAMMLGLDGGRVMMLLPGFWLGTPILSLLAGLSAALGIGSQRGTGLLALLILPFVIPVVIFANGGLQMADHALNGAALGPIWMLAGLLVLAVTLVPIAGAAAIRLAVRG